MNPEEETKLEVRWNTTKYSYREYCMLGIIVILMIAFAISIYAEKKTIESYAKPYNECIKKLNYETNGYVADTEINIVNVTVTPKNYR